MQLKDNADIPFTRESVLKMLTWGANKYSLEELRTNDFKNEQMPKEWFNDWLRQLA